VKSSKGSKEDLSWHEDFFFFFAVLRLELGAFTLSHSTNPIFVKHFIEIGSQGTIFPGWLPTAILLISIS
jgi:hypothetical protein